MDSQEVHTMHDDREHVISIVLSHQNWQKSVKLQPQPLLAALPQDHGLLGRRGLRVKRRGGAQWGPDDQKSGEMPGN